MNARVVFAHIGLVALLAAAFAGGIVYQRDGRHSSGGHAGHRDDPDRFFAQFRARLELDDAQAARVKQALDALHREMTVLMSGFHEQFEANRRRAWADIREALTATQLPKFEQLVAEIERDHAGH